MELIFNDSSKELFWHKLIFSIIPSTEVKNIDEDFEMNFLYFAFRSFPSKQQHFLLSKEE